MKLRPLLLPPPLMPSPLKLLLPPLLLLLMPSPLKALPLPLLMPSLRKALLLLPPRLVPPPRTPLPLLLPLPKRSNSFSGEEKANLRVGFFYACTALAMGLCKTKNAGLAGVFCL